MRYANLKITGATDAEIKKNKLTFRTLVVTTFALVLLGGIVLYFGKAAKAFFNPISIISSVSAANLKETDGRINILVLGSDKRQNGVSNSNLTDTILLASIGKYENDIVLISVPRDLWVETSKGYSTKINAVYALEGVSELTKVVENVLGLPIHYYAVINFDIFKEVIDILDGVTVNIETAFDDYYFPLEGKENAPESERYETIHFNAGVQKMDGETALKYVRSRKGTNDEGTDFARSKRQQKVVMAIKDKAISLRTVTNVTKIKELYDTYSKNVETNIDFSTIQNFYLLSQQLNFDTIRSLVLDDRSAPDEGGLLYAPTDTSLYGGAYVLIPRTGNFSQMHAYVQRFLFGE